MIIGLIFTMRQYYITIKPIDNNRLLTEAEVCINAGLYDQAISIYQKKALQNVPAALNNLGYLYYSGMGVTQNMEKARDYYRKAISKGSYRAINNLIILDFEVFSEDSKEELADIFQASYEVKDEARVACALSYALGVDIDTISYSNIRTGSYDDLFDNNGEKFRRKLLSPDNTYENHAWVFCGTYYYSVSGKEYETESSKLILKEGFENGVSKEKLIENHNVEPSVLAGFPSDTIYVYNYYQYNKKCTDRLETGLERVLSVDGSK